MSPLPCNPLDKCCDEVDGKVRGRQEHISQVEETSLRYTYIKNVIIDRRQSLKI